MRRRRAWCGRSRDRIRNSVSESRRHRRHPLCSHVSRPTVGCLPGGREMKTTSFVYFTFLALLCGVAAHEPNASADQAPAAFTAKQVVESAIDADSWGRGGVEAT